MSCLPCFAPHDVKWVIKRLENYKKEKQRQPENEEQEEEKQREVNNNIEALSFTFRELATATKNFRRESLIGEGGFGRVYKGRLAKDGPEVAVKQLDRSGAQGHKEFLVEVLMLSLLHDDNLVNLIGYCADGEQRLLVYEYMPLGSLEDHLLDLEPGKRALDWHERIKIALGAAKGLKYLHDKANPPVIYRDLKPSNILLDRDYNAKLSDFGLASLGIGGDNIYASSRIMGTFGYCAPEYQKTGELTIKSDVYSFGVVLLELITGRRAVDTTKKGKEQTLVAWAEPIFKEVNRFPEVVDPLLQGNFPTVDLQQAIAIAAMCVNEEPSVRPLMSDVVSALTFIVESAQGFSHSPTPTSSTEDDEDHKARERELALAEALAWASANSNHP